MASQSNRTASIWSFMALSSLALTPLSCGGAQEDYTVLSPSSATSPPASDAATLPKTVIRQLEACAKRTIAPQVEASYAMLFDIEITPEGNVFSAKLRDSTLGNDDIESCMVHAFDDITLPVSTFELRSSRPASGGESMRHSRDKLGVAQAAGGIIALGPIVIAMGAA